MRNIFPPRPKNTIHPRQLPKEEERGIYVCQRKFDGDRCVIHIEDGKVAMFNRRGKQHPVYKFPAIQKELLQLASSHHWLCLDAEILDSKIVVLFDVLAFQGDYLLGVNQMTRLSLLSSLCDNPQMPCSCNLALYVSSHIWLAECWEHDFLQKFDDAAGNDIIEGVVLREKNSCLDQAGSKAFMADWLVRCRHSCKNYRF